MKCSYQSNFIHVLIFLSLLLAGFMYVAFYGVPEQMPYTPIAERIEIDSEAYKQDLRSIIKSFDEQIFVAQDDLERLLAVETALGGILELRVPVEFKDVHLGLAVALNQMQTALKSDSRSISEQLADIEIIKVQNTWLVE